MIYLYLFIEFFKTGLFAIGGGLATLPFLYSISDKFGWFTYADLANMVAVSESTPGPIGINVATYAGMMVGSLIGAITATIALIIPSIIIIIIISHFLKKFKNSKIVKNLFYGLRPASTGLIAAAGYSIIVMSLLCLEKFNETKHIMDLFNFKSVAFFIILLMLTNIKKFKDLHPAFFIAIAAIVGIAFKI